MNRLEIRVMNCLPKCESFVIGETPFGGLKPVSLAIPYAASPACIQSVISIYMDRNVIERPGVGADDFQDRYALFRKGCNLSTQPFEPVRVVKRVQRFEKAQLVALTRRQESDYAR